MVSVTAARIQVIAGALMQPDWLPAAPVRERLPLLAALADQAQLVAVPAPLPPASDALPRDLAHDRWLRARLEERIGPLSIAPGAMRAIRLSAPLVRQQEGWLVEPVHFHLARDHVVLMAGAHRGLDLSQAERLIESIGSLLDEDSLVLKPLSATTWLLTGDGAAPWRLECASVEAASGRNVAGYLPDGPDQRRFRKLLNEIQMSWHEHPVNQEREAAGALPINSVWLSGPVTSPAVDAWNQALADGRLALDDSLMDARLRDDRDQWLQALRLLDSRLHAWLSAAQPPEILLCGDSDAHWLQRSAGGAAGWALSLRSSLAGRRTHAARAAVADGASPRGTGWRRTRPRPKEA